MDYQQLKLGKHGLPTWDALAPIVLTLAEQRSEWHGRALNAAVADDLNLPATLRQLTYPNQQNIVENRAGWAVSELTTAGLLRRTRRGFYGTTDLGRQVLHGDRLVDRNVIHQQPKYIQHQQDLQERQTRNQISPAVEPEAEEITISLDRLTQQVKGYNAEVATDLLQRIRESAPEFFENLVVELLSAMGYKGPNGSAWVTQLSNDGGIDGVINQDALEPARSTYRPSATKRKIPFSGWLSTHFTGRCRGITRTGASSSRRRVFPRRRLKRPRVSRLFWSMAFS